MTHWKIALQSLKYYSRTNLAIGMGVAAATAVLAGALIVGDSMRSSLRELTLERLGKIDEILISDGFFRQELAAELQQTQPFQQGYQDVSPVIMFPGGTVQSDQSENTRRAGQVNVLGIQDEFWTFDHSKNEPHLELAGESAIINQALALELEIAPADVASGDALITVRIPKQNQLPSDSALGRKTDLIESIVDLKVIQIVPTRGLGRFGMHPSQADPLNVFLPLARLQESLRRTVLKHKSDPLQVNALMISSKSSHPPSPPNIRIASRCHPPHIGGLWLDAEAGHPGVWEWARHRNGV